MIPSHYNLGMEFSFLTGLHGRSVETLNKPLRVGTQVSEVFVTKTLECVVTFDSLDALACAEATNATRLAAVQTGNASQARSANQRVIATERQMCE